MNGLSRIFEDVGRSLAPIRAVGQGAERFSSAKTDARRLDNAVSPDRAAIDFSDDIELLGRGGGRGRPVVSVPSSAFFAQHIGQHPEARNERLESMAADAAYRDAADLGVFLHRAEPLSLAI